MSLAPPTCLPHPTVLSPQAMEAAFPLWTPGWAEARREVSLHVGPGPGPARGPKIRHSPRTAGLRPGRTWTSLAGLWRAAARPCCSITGAGADVPRGLTWGPGPWPGLRQPQRDAGQGQQGPAVPGEAGPAAPLILPPDCTHAEVPNTSKGQVCRPPYGLRPRSVSDAIFLNLLPSIQRQFLDQKQLSFPRHSMFQHQPALQCPFLVIYFLNYIIQLTAALPAHQLSQMGLFSSPLISVRSPRLPLSQLL